MTSRRLAAPPAAPGAVFPERPPRMDMQNFIYLNRPGHATAVARFLGLEETTLVIGDTPVGWNLSEQADLLYPDLMVAFGIDIQAVITARGFSIDDQGKPPEFVLEVASVHTARNDYTTKRSRYARYGISEYWRFDPSDPAAPRSRRRYPEPLAGDALVDGRYEPLPVTGSKEEGYRGFSRALNLYVCWENGQLRFYDPATQRYLLTHDEAEDERITAESQRDAERLARMAAEAEAAAAQARIRQLQDELDNRSQ